jgi:hypothetical protein
MVGLSPSTLVGQTVFEDRVENATILNWEQGVDAKIDVLNPTEWAAEVVNGNTVLTAGGNQSLTLMGISNIGPVASDFLM